MRLLITGYPGWLSRRFLDTLRQYPSFSHLRCLVRPSEHPSLPAEKEFECVHGDLADPVSLERAAQGMDAVLHMAAVIHVKKIPEFYTINRDGTRNLLEACAKHGVKRFVFISTNAAQGFCPDKSTVLDETATPYPASHYGKSKYQAEQIVLEYHAQKKLEGVVLRPSMFYGPPVPPRHIDIYQRIKKGRFPVFGTGEYRRSVVYIDNLVQGIHLALRKPEAAGQVYYITDKITPTLLDLLNAMAKELRAPLKIMRLPAFLASCAEMLDRVLSFFGIYWMLPHIVGEACQNIAYRVDKAEKELGYRPEFSYEEGYRRTIAWCRERQLI